MNTATQLIVIGGCWVMFVVMVAFCHWDSQKNRKLLKEISENRKERR